MSMEKYTGIPYKVAEEINRLERKLNNLAFSCGLLFVAVFLLTVIGILEVL